MWLPRTGAALTLALTLAGCGAPPEPSSSPAAPTIVTESYAGDWTGTWTIVTSTAAGNLGCPFAANNVTRAQLLLDQFGGVIYGVGVYGSYRYPQEIASYDKTVAALESNGHLRLSNAYGKSPSFVHKLEWDLRRVASDRLEGTLRATETWYKVSGSCTMDGTVVLTR